MPHTLIFFTKVAYKPQMTLDRALAKQGFADDIREALDPDVTITRYGRNWRFSQPKIHNRKFLIGKLGFISPTTERMTDYDENQKDFVEQSVDSKQGHYVQWAIDFDTQILAFETKPPDIRFQSFVGAFKGLLDEHPHICLTVEHIVESAKFFEWAEKLDRITKFTASIRAPNPNFESRPRIIRELLEDTNADFAKVELSKGKGSDKSLNTEKTIEDLVKYGEEGYSTIVAHGLKNEQQKLFDSRRKIAVERVDIPTTSTVEMVWNYIINALRKFR